MARPNVPKFGNWENDANTPYTVYFEKARQTRGTGKIINPNDPEENPDMFPTPGPSAPPPAAPLHPKPKRQTEEPIGRGGTARQRREHRPSQEDEDYRLFANAPPRNENIGRRGANEPSQQRGRGSSSGRTGRQSAGSEHSFDRSPLHPRGTPGRSFESSHATPGRSKNKQETPDRGAAVPRFGEWDENDPQSADNYTHIFNKVREEKQGTPSGTPSRTPNNPQTHNSNKERMKCCFPWLCNGGP